MSTAVLIIDDTKNGTATDAAGVDIVDIVGVGVGVVTDESPTAIAESSKIMMRFLEEEEKKEKTEKTEEEQEYRTLFDDADDDADADDIDDNVVDDDNTDAEDIDDNDNADAEDIDDNVVAEANSNADGGEGVGASFEEVEASFETVGASFEVKEIGAFFEEHGDSMDGSLYEEDLTFSEGGGGDDDTLTLTDGEGDGDGDGERYLSDEDDELNLRYESFLDGAFKKTGFLSKDPKKMDFLDQTGAVVNTLYRQFSSLSIRAQNSDRNLATKEGAKGKTNTGSKHKKSSKSKKKESFLKHLKRRKTAEDEELTSESTAGSTSTGDGNTVGIKNSFSTESDDSRYLSNNDNHNHKNKPKNEDQGSSSSIHNQDPESERHRGCGGCLHAEELVALFPMASATTTDTASAGGDSRDVSKRDYKCSNQEFDEVGDIEIPESSKKPDDTTTTTTFHERFVAPCAPLQACSEAERAPGLPSRQLSRWKNRVKSRGEENIRSLPPPIYFDDGIDSILDGIVVVNDGEYDDRDQEVVYKDPNNSTQESSFFRESGCEKELYAPYDLLATKCGSIARSRSPRTFLSCGGDGVMMFCMEDKIETSTLCAAADYEDDIVFQSDAPEKTKSKDIDPALLQAEAKNLANAVLHSKHPIKNIVVAVSSSKTLYRVQQLLYKTESQAKNIFLRGHSVLTDNATYDDMSEDESFIVREYADYSIRSYPFDEAEQQLSPSQDLGEILPGVKPTDGLASPDSLQEIKEPLPPFVKESLEVAEMVLSESRYGLCDIEEEIESDIPPTPLMVSYENAEMITSAWAYGPSCICIGVEHDTTNGPLTMEPSKLYPVELTTETEDAIEEEGAYFATEIALPSQFVQQDPELETAKEEHEVVTVGSSSSDCDATKKALEAKKAKKRSFWKPHRTRTGKTSRHGPSHSTTILIKSDDDCSADTKKMTKKSRRLSRRKTKKSSKPESAVHVQLSSGGKVHAILSAGETACEVSMRM